MKKKGFTLAEILIALAIVGVIAAIGVPALSKAKPDADKMKVLKAYKIIKDINTELLNNPSLYFDSTLGFRDTTTPDDSNYNHNGQLNGSNKYPTLFACFLDTSRECSDIAASSNITVTTSDGIEWNIRQNGNNKRIRIDVNPNGSNQNFNQNQVHPDRFIFIIDNNGRVTGSDSLTQAYLENPYKLNDKTDDYARAKNIPSAD